MIIVSNASIYLDLSFNETDKQYGKEYLLSLIKRQAQILYRQKDLTVEVELLDGSLKILYRVTVSLYIAIGLYGSFRSGIDYLKNDSQLLHKIVIADLKKNGLTEDKIKASKANAGSIDNIKRLINRLDKINNKPANKNNHREINNIKNYTDKLLHDIRDKEDQDFLMNELYRIDKNKIVYQEDSPYLPKPESNHPMRIFMRNNEEKDKYQSYLEHQYTFSEATKNADEQNHLKLYQ